MKKEKFQRSLGRCSKKFETINDDEYIEYAKD